MKEIMVQENDAMFDEIIKHCVIDMNIACWDYSSDNQSRYLQWTLIDKKTGHHVGWLVYKEWADATYHIKIKENSLHELHVTSHIKIKEDSLHELLKQDKKRNQTRRRVT